MWLLLPLLGVLLALSGCVGFEGEPPEPGALPPMTYVGIWSPFYEPERKVIERVIGMDLAIFSAYHFNFDGVSLAAINGRNRVRGLRLGLFQSTAELNGMVVDVIGINDGTTRGAHLSLLGNGVDRLCGVQMGLVSCVIDTRSHEPSYGLMVAGLSNFSDDFRGTQIAAFNVVEKTRTMKGVQIGLCNIAPKMRGVQFGIFNYRHGTDNDWPIPLVRIRWDDMD